MFLTARPETSRSSRTRTGSVAAVLAALMLTAVPVAYAGPYNDLRSPDARDQALRAQGGPSIDLRSPDARDNQSALASPSIDLRSPDARDAQSAFADPPVDLRSPDARDAQHVGTHFATPPASAGFDVEDGALIVGGTVALALLMLGGWMFVRRPSKTVPSASGPVVSR